MTVVLGEKPTVHESCRIRESRLGKWTDIGPNCTIAESDIGDYTYFAGDASVIYATIGPFCSIASHVRVNPGNHPMDRVMQHHCTYRRIRYGLSDSDDADFFEWRRSNACSIGRDVWLGHGVVVMPGTRIGNGSIVGSGAVVTHDVGDYEIWAGVPAKLLRRRFSPEVAAGIEATSWWTWDRDTLAARLPEFNDVGAFIERYSDRN